MKKYIIGLGCSWTQGEGGYPDEIVKRYNGKVQQYTRHAKNPSNVWKYERENSWVNVLCRDHFTEYTPMNLGVCGIGNRAAVDQLHFCDNIDWKNATGIIVLMWSGFERLDFVGQNLENCQEDQADDAYSNGTFKHYKWRTAWPYADAGGYEQPIWSVYGKMLYSQQFIAINQMLTLLNLQAFAQSKGFKLVIANAFNTYFHIDDTDLRVRPHEFLKYYTKSLYEKFDWSTYMNQDTDYVSFVQKLVWLDGLIPEEDWGSWFNFYSVRSYPSEYLTNCEGAHPTIKGYKVIAEELVRFIQMKNYV